MRKKRLTALALCLLMALSLLPLGARAEAPGAEAKPEIAAVSSDGGRRSVTVIDPYYREYWPALYERVRKELGSGAAARADAAAGQASEPRATVTTVEDAGLELLAALKARRGSLTITIRVPMASADTFDEQEALLLDIWNAAMRTSTDPAEGDYLRRASPGFGADWNEEPYLHNGYAYLEYAIEPYYWGGLTAAHERELAAAVDAVLKSLRFTERTSNYDKIRRIYRWIVDNVEYDFDGLQAYEEALEEDPFNPDPEAVALMEYDQTAYSAIIDRKTVCAGFSHLLYYMLWRAEIPARALVGQGGKKDNMGGHAWNLVWFRGAWYSLDVTWDVTMRTVDGDERYFLRGRDTDFYNPGPNVLNPNYYHIPSGPDDDGGLDDAALVAASNPDDYGARTDADGSACETHTQAGTTYDTDSGGHVYWCGVCAHTQLEPFAVTPLTVDSLTVSKTTAKVGDTVTWTAAASGGKAPLKYCFYVYRDGKVVQKGSYGAANTTSFKIDAAGAWTAKVFVKDAAGTVVNKTGGQVTVADATPLTIKSLTADESRASVGDTITWTAAAAGGTAPLKYCFYVYKDGKVVQKGAYGTANTISYAVSASGVYSAKVFVKDAAGMAANLAGGEVDASAPLVIDSVAASTPDAEVGDTIIWTANASGGRGTLKYCFYVYRDGKVVQKGTYGTAKTYSYTPGISGTYTVKVFVKDAAGTVVSLTGGAVTITVST